MLGCHHVLQCPWSEAVLQPICLQSPFLPITAVEQDPRETPGERISYSILLASLHHSEASPTPLSEIVSSLTADFTGRKLEDMVTHLLTAYTEKEKVPARKRGCQSSKRQSPFATSGSKVQLGMTTS